MMAIRFAHQHLEKRWVDKFASRQAIRDNRLDNGVFVLMYRSDKKNIDADRKYWRVSHKIDGFYVNAIVPLELHEMIETMSAEGYTEDEITCQYNIFCDTLNSWLENSTLHGTECVSVLKGDGHDDIYESMSNRVREIRAEPRRPFTMQ